MGISAFVDKFSVNKIQIIDIIAINFIKSYYIHTQFLFYFNNYIITTLHICTYIVIKYPPKYSLLHIFSLPTLNSKQNFSDQKCLLFIGFTISEKY